MLEFCAASLGTGARGRTRGFHVWEEGEEGARRVGRGHRSDLKSFFFFLGVTSPGAALASPACCWSLLQSLEKPRENPGVPLWVLCDVELCGGGEEEKKGILGADGVWFAFASPRRAKGWSLARSSVGFGAGLPTVP